MNEIGAFLANYYILFIIIAIFAIFALIGYKVETKNKEQSRMIPTPPPQPGETLDVLKSSLANKSLNSMVNDSLQNTNTNSNINENQNGFQQADKL